MESSLAASASVTRLGWLAYRPLLSTLFPLRCLARMTIPVSEAADGADNEEQDHPHVQRRAVSAVRHE